MATHPIITIKKHDIARCYSVSVDGIVYAKFHFSQSIASVRDAKEQAEKYAKDAAANLTF